MTTAIVNLGVYRKKRQEQTQAAQEKKRDKEIRQRPLNLLICEMHDAIEKGIPNPYPPTDPRFNLYNVMADVLK